MIVSPRLSLATLLLLALLAVLPVAAQVAETAAPTDPATTTRKTDEESEYSQGVFLQWLNERLAGIADRPATFVVVIDRTDTVRGDGDSLDLLPNTWRSRLLDPLFESYLVAGRDSVDSDALVIAAYGRRQTEEVLSVRVDKRPEARQKAVVLNKFPDPFTNTPYPQWGTDLDQALRDGIRIARERASGRNQVVVLVTDGFLQAFDGASAHAPADATDHRNFVVHGDNGAVRHFEIYLWANDFPDRTQFVKWDGTTLKQGVRVDLSKTTGGDPTVGVRRDDDQTHLPGGYLAQIEAEKLTALLRAAAVLGALLLIMLVVLAWSTAHYKVLVDGLPKTIWVAPWRRSRPVPVTNPHAPGDIVGIVQVDGPGILGWHRLVLRPQKPFALIDAHGKPASATPSRKQGAASYLPLRAGWGAAVDNVVRFSAPRPAQAPIAHDEALPEGAGEPVHVAAPESVAETVVQPDPYEGTIRLSVARRGLLARAPRVARPVNRPSAVGRHAS